MIDLTIGQNGKIKKLYIGICNSQEAVPSKFFWSFLNIKNVYPTVIRKADHPWDVVRHNMLIDGFLKSDCDVYVQMDIDQEYPSDYFEKMMPLVERYKIIAPVICDRWAHSGYLPLMFSENNFPKLRPLDISGKEGVIETPYAHTNFFCLKEVWEKIPPPWFEAKLRDDGLDRANHVDFDVLDKIKKAGYPIYVNLDVKVKHLTTIGV